MSTWVRTVRILDRDQVITAIANLRAEWEQAVDGIDLVDVSCSVGLLLVDLVIALRLTPGEMHQALGSHLADQLDNSQKQFLD